MNSDNNYSIHLDNKYGYLKVIDIPGLIDSCRDKWFNQTLCQVNDCVVRLGIVEGEFHWHVHNREDEMFFVLEGQLLIDLEGKTVTLDPQCGFTVPRGIKHRTRAPRRTVMLMVEGIDVKPTGD